MRGIPLFTGYPRILTVKDGIVPLLESLANEILAAEELFLKNPKDFHSLEISAEV